MKKGILKKAAYKSYQLGHPWLSNDDLIDKTLIPSRPALMSLGGGWWFCSPKSYLRLRRMGPKGQTPHGRPDFESITNSDHFDKAFGPWLTQHLMSLLEEKSKALAIFKEERAFRWVFSENDFIPGLIVDIFNQDVVVQINSAPIEVFWFAIRKALVKAYGDFYNTPPSIIELRNAPVRKKEGLEVIPNEMPSDSSQKIFWNGLWWTMSPGQQQKTGVYFDQRENHKRTLAFAQQFQYKTAWDLYCYQGGFGLHLMAGGLEVTAVDSSAKAIETLRHNVSLNSLPLANANLETADVESWLTKAHEDGLTTDLIILDPPSLVRSRQDIASAQKLFTHLNVLAMGCLKPGGMLVSCVCSHHFSKKLITESLQQAAQKAAKTYESLGEFGPSVDHPVLPEFPEGNYLQAHFLKLR